MNPTLIKNSRAWRIYENKLIARLGGEPFNCNIETPACFPLMVHSYLSRDVNGNQVNHVFFYSDHAERLLELFNISYDEK